MMIDDLINRIGNLTPLKWAAFSDADGMFYGATPTIRRLIRGARDACDDGRLSLADRICDVAERKLASERRKFQKKTKAEMLQHVEDNKQPIIYRGCWSATNQRLPPARIKQ